MFGLRTVLLTVISLAPAALAAQERGGLSPAQVEAWRGDLRVLARELPQRHRNAFARMTRQQWDSAVAQIDAKIPRLQRHQVIVELMRLVAMVHDGHTFLAPDFEERIAFHTLPVQLYDFSDGLFIIAADKTHADLAGARVVKIGSASSPTALKAVAALVSHEGDWWARFRGARYLAIPEVLNSLGLSDDSSSATLVVDQDGRQRSVTLRATMPAAGGGHDDAASGADWVDMKAAGQLPLWQQHPGEPFWFTVLPDKTLYVGYRSVVFFANGQTNEQFFHHAFAAGDSAGVERVVIDIRTNGGGNNFLNRFLVKEIIRRPALDQAERLLVLIGRATFSAAQNLVNELDYYTNATFIGEPTGNAPNQYGDPRRLELPRSGLRVFISSLLWQGHIAADTRVAFTPDVFVEAASVDYRAGKDPVLETALRRATGPTLAQQLAEPAARADTIAVRRVVEQYRTNPENRYRDLESDLNQAGYALLQEAKMEAAVTVFRVNAGLFPSSANAFDSLGESLERAGRREEAVTAYRQALKLNPNFGSSREGLRRLGASP
jgi:tetratricopeptide (TPR) repeat protein